LDDVARKISKFLASTKSISNVNTMSNSFNNRPESVRKYFTNTPIKPADPDYSKDQTKMAVGGGLLFVTLFLLFSGQGLYILLGVASGYFGFSFLKNGISEYLRRKNEYEKSMSQYERDFDMAEPKPSDSQIEQWMNEDIEKITREALRRLDLENDDCSKEPWKIGGPSALKDTRYKVGQDGKTRYSHFNILVVFLTKYHVATYQCNHGLEYGQTLSDRTQEFPYKEITNLGTQIVKKLIHLIGDQVESENGMHEFFLATSGANIIQVAYEFARNTDHKGDLYKTRLSKSLNAI
jgi:hypothetical protein